MQPLLGGCGHPMAQLVSAERLFAHKGRRPQILQARAPIFNPTPYA